MPVENIRSISFHDLFEAIRFPVLRWGLAIIFLPFETFLALDAIGITLIRRFITHKHLLQWTTAAHFAISFKNTQFKPGWRWRFPSYSIHF